MLVSLPRFNAQSYPYMIGKIDNQWKIIDVNIGQAVAEVKGVAAHHMLFVGQSMVIGISEDKKTIEYYNVGF